MVGDSRAQADVIGTALRREGYDVFIAPDGATAMKRLTDSVLPDLVLLDLVLPDMNGVEVMRVVKARRNHFIPVIILSAQSDLEARVKGFSLGADDYLSKDAHESEILARVGVMRRFKDLQDRLRAANDKLERLSVTDGLTELYNHRHFQTRLREEFGRAARHGEPLSLLMLDLDHFKDVNDRWLHPFGDKVLRETARLIRGSLREHDISARYGGEEFAVILPKAPLADALGVARRIARAIGDHVFLAEGFQEPATGQTPEVHVTASVGVAAFFPGSDVTSPEGLVKRADEALFQAKRSGRDRVWAQGERSEHPERAGPDAPAPGR